MASEEKAIQTFRPSYMMSFRYFVIAIITGAIAAFFFLYPISWLQWGLFGISFQSVLAWILAIVAFVSLLRAFLKRFSLRYTYTETSVIRRKSGMRRIVQQLPYVNIKRIDIKQSLLQRMARVGTVTIDSGEDALELEIIRDPEGARKFISKRMTR